VSDHVGAIETAAADILDRCAALRDASPDPGEDGTQNAPSGAPDGTVGDGTGLRSVKGRWSSRQKKNRQLELRADTLMSDAVPQMIELGLGNADVENEQRDRDREHTVAERLGPAGVPAVAHGAAFDAGHRCTALPSTDVDRPVSEGPGHPRR
jgi:hypothetical protein